MPDKKKKLDKVEFVPSIVEVYGEENMNQDDGEKQVVEKAIMADGLDGGQQTKSVEETEDGRETLKTEVVENKSQDLEAAVEKEKMAELVKDEVAFEDEIGHQRKAVRSVFGAGLIVFLVVFGITGWAFYLKTIWLPKETVTQVMVASPTPIGSPEPTPTVVVPLTRDKIALEILNGSGVVGLASKKATIFKELGYVSIETGNGEATKETKVFVQKEMEPKLTLLMKDIEDSLQVASVAGYLKPSDKATVRILLGK